EYRSVYFIFQAEDGIRLLIVTGVQTCALPISGLGIVISKPSNDKPLTVISPLEGTPAWNAGIRAGDVISQIEGVDTLDMTIDDRSEERRVGKEGRLRWPPVNQ